MVIIYTYKQLTDYLYSLKLGEYKITKGQLSMSREWVIRKNEKLLEGFTDPDEGIKRMVELNGKEIKNEN